MHGYKAIFKSRAFRFRLLRALLWVPDGVMLRLQFFIKHRRWLNLKDPVRFTHRIQWYKINYRRPIMTTCVDKIDVRQFVSDRGYGHLLTELYMTADDAASIDLSQLPDRFVLKTNNGSDTNVIVSDKKMIEEGDLKKFDEWLARDYFAASREWPYKNVPPRILAEEFLEDTEGKFEGINDYKFFCFDGVPKFIQLDVDRSSNHKRKIFTAEWKDTGVGTDKPDIPGDVPPPENLEEMKSIAAGLSKGFPFVRVDLYSIKGRIYFGEMTFFPWSGFQEFSPDTFDVELGMLWPQWAR